jgi:NADPH2:quinone reductase
MRAVVVTGFGPPSKARIADMHMPRCEATDVLIKVAAAGVNPVDWKECEGNLAKFFVYPETWIPGLDAAGIVHAVGSNVSKFRPGDRVVAFSDRGKGHNGTFAEYVRVVENLAAVVPSSVTLEEAAAIPTAAVTGYQALIRPNKGVLSKGDTAFLHGASGGVGSYAVQFAKALGLRVAASCSAKNIDYVRSLGADLVLDYATGNLAKAVRQWEPKGVDAVIDCVSGGTLPDALDALRPRGKLISIATLTQDGDISGDIKKAAQLGFSKIFAFVEYDRVGQELAEILVLMDKKVVKTPPLINYPLEAGPEAMQRMKDGGVKGKIILKIG